MDFHNSISTGGPNSHFNLILGIALFFAILILASLIWFIYQYKETVESAVEQKKRNLLLELIWMVIPTVLVLIMFLYGWKKHEIVPSLRENKGKISQNTLLHQNNTLSVNIGIGVFQRPAACSAYRVFKDR